MPVLKSHDAAGFARDAIVLDLGDIGRQAARIRMQAEAKAAQIINDAERKAQQLIEQAEGIGFERGRAEGLARGVEEGRAQGHADALAAAQEQFAQLQTAWADVAEQLDGQRRAMDREARAAVLQFALKMAELLVHRVIEVDPTVVVDQLAAALALVMQPMDVAVRINPADRDTLAEAMPQLMAEFNHFQHVQLLDDETIHRGGCVVTYGQGAIDATVQTQIARVIDVILPPEDRADEEIADRADEPDNPDDAEP